MISDYDYKLANSSGADEIYHNKTKLIGNIEIVFAIEFSSFENNGYTITIAVSEQ